MADFREIVFNGHSMLDFGFYLKKGAPAITVPKRNVKIVSIPGSIVGDTFVDDGNYPNTNITYSFRSVPSKIPTDNEDILLKELTEWLNKSSSKYVKVYDTIRPGYSRRGILTNISDITKNFEGCYDISLTFSVQPYWYSNLGQEARMYSAFTQENTYPVYNPEKYRSYPYIKISNLDTTDGFTITIGSRSLQISQVNGYVEIDCETGEVYKGNTPKNQYVTGNKRLYLAAGSNEIEITPASNTPRYQLELTPRWRCF